MYLTSVPMYVHYSPVTVLTQTKDILKAGNILSGPQLITVTYESLLHLAPQASPHADECLLSHKVLNKNTLTAYGETKEDIKAILLSLCKEPTLSLCLPPSLMT